MSEQPQPPTAALRQISGPSLEMALPGLNTQTTLRGPEMEPQLQEGSGKWGFVW